MTKGTSNFMSGSLKLSIHPAKFDDHRHCGSGDKIVLVCHVILQDHNLDHKTILLVIGTLLVEI